MAFYKTKIFYLTLSWFLFVFAGFYLLEIYSNSPGMSGPQPIHWPTNQSELVFEKGHEKMVVFIHPRCPCSRATLVELSKLVSRFPHRFDLDIVFYHPLTADAKWFNTTNWDLAKGIPNAVLHSDPDGKLAMKFGALTSGHTLLFNSEGFRVFSGGITGARGHEGDNLGTDAITNYLTHQVIPTQQTRVFGCALFKKHVLGEGS